MRRREPQEDALDRLGSEARSVLAVLVMAALWPSRFPGAWVSVTGFAQAGVLLGERADRESLKAAIRRGLRQLSKIPAVPVIECRRTLDRDPLNHRARRDRDRRLAAPAGPILEAWLLKHGPAVISPDLWRDFFPPGFRARLCDPHALREVVRHSLRQADCCLQFAALVVPPSSPEARTLRRIRKLVSITLGSSRP
jgi:hypothetical protein